MLKGGQQGFRRVKIHGIGIDVVETERIAGSIAKFGERFLHRVYLTAEIEYSQSMKYPARHFAARFAAKEAISKAFGTGIGGQLGWRDIEICRRPNGEPYAVLHGGGREMAGRLGVVQILVSLTHTDHYAAANAVLIATGDEAGARQGEASSS